MWSRCTPRNSLNTSSIGLRRTLARTLRRPRCGMPTTTSSTPSSVTLSTMVLRPGIIDSTPSRPKRLADAKRIPRIDSNFSEYARRSRIMAFSSLVKGVGCTSIRLRIQFSFSRSCTCSHSTPMVEQYVSWRKSTNSWSVVWPSPSTSALPRRPATPSTNEPESESPRSQSETVSKPYVAGSRSLTGWGTWMPNGSRMAISWPRRWYAAIR
mmetsp:Transcript_61349/g.168427  ORF Transcript_61349/g.168427 Transcript_61349/m.168427 type:complete len:211 (-) Transcript_61349:344-976(-)